MENNINISVIPNGWDNDNIPKIEALLKDTASHINRELVPSFTEEICVEKWDRNYPFTHFRTNQSRTHKISLTAKWPYWAQFAYQFAHEFCHVLSDLNKLRNCKNGWFHEAICELASVFTLRRMKERWCTDPPEPPFPEQQGKQFAESLGKYEDDMREKYTAKWRKEYGTDPITLIYWLSDYEEEMRNISTGENTNGDRHTQYRLMYSLVAYALLPIFEEKPSGWNTIRALPNSNAYIEQYLDEWLKSVEEPEQSFVRRCKKRIESQICPFNI